jgi:hypothetical protein
MISLESKEQMELLFSPSICWRKLSQEIRHEILEQLSLLLLSSIEEKVGPVKRAKEDQLCQVK